MLCANTKEARELSTPRSTDSDRLIDSASLGKVAWAQVGCSGLCRDCRSPRQNGKMREASQLGYSMFRCKSGPGELRKALCSSGLSTAMAMITGCTRRLTAKVKSVKACQVSDSLRVVALVLGKSLEGTSLRPLCIPLPVAVGPYDAAAATAAPEHASFQHCAWAAQTRSSRSEQTLNSRTRLEAVNPGWPAAWRPQGLRKAFPELGCELAA